MDNALVMYSHGLGDVIQLTPHLRHLFSKGYTVDLMCRKEVRTSHLLDGCPYINELIDILNPWQSPAGFGPQTGMNINKFRELSKDYDWSGMALHQGMGGSVRKLDFTARELGLSLSDKSLEVYIPKNIEEEAMGYIENFFPDGYIFMHTMIEWHRNHNWETDSCLEWVKANLPDLPIVDTGYTGTHKSVHNDINYTFVLLREATHRVLSSSIFIHACDAMGVEIDVANYGGTVKYAWPLDESLLKKVRERGKWIK